MKYFIQQNPEIGFNIYLQLIFFFVGIFLISLLLIPKIRLLVLQLNVKDIPDHRSSHSIPIPSFGGIIFYISYILVLFFLQFYDDHYVSLTLLASISILFLTGFLDDLLDISAKWKFLGQFLGVALLMLHPDFRIISMHGFMGIYELPLFISVGGSMFFLLAMINAFNLLDGIDGLTATTGIIVASFYSFMFYQLEYSYYLFICIATIATLLAFLRFNLSIAKKIFLGDTGSLVIGLVLGLLTLKLMSSDSVSLVLSFNQKQLPLFLIAVLYVPILDICRVMLLRFIKGVSIFKPDRNHIHHIIIDCGLSHRKASFLIGSVNFSVALIMFFVIMNFNTVGSVFLLAGIFVFSFILLFLINKTKSAVKLRKTMKQVMLRMFFY
jgi:UDP-N-acetylmuramyl pentapeptide phosphotransferase/UDP-N-acetylglucosamine-1-phosphate transferase